jgi:putative Mg2+ transporter-C (MgtC) family protein
MAGLRTHVLVAVACCGLQLISLYGYTSDMRALGLVLDEYVRVDPSRVASTTMQGIGLIAAGTVIHGASGNVIHGLTTATTIWVLSAAHLWLK